MEWDAVGAIGEIVGAIAVVATLLYLAGQIRTAQVAGASAATYSAIESFSRWRSSILDNFDVAEALTKANRGEALTEREELLVRTLADDFFVLIVVGPTEIEGWGQLDRTPLELEYLKMIFEENPGLIPQWQRYRRIAILMSEDSVPVIDKLVSELTASDVTAG